MALLEVLLTGVGGAIAKSVAKMWLKDHEIVGASVDSLLDILKKKVTDIQQAKAASRMLDGIGDRAAKSVMVMLEKEEVSLEDARLELVANATSLTISSTTIDAALLADRNLEPEKLTQYFLERSNSDGGNEGLAGTGEGARHFSDEETLLYGRMLLHASGLIIDIASQMPLFSERVLGEILRRESNIESKIDRLIDDVDRLLVAQSGENLDDDRFETNYRSACIRRYDQLELFGVDLQEGNKRYKLSVAYVTLEVERLKMKEDPASKEYSHGLGEEEEFEERDSIPVDLALVNSKRLLVRGPAGSGKTTLMHWAAVASSRRELDGELVEFNELVPFLLKLRDFSGRPLPGPEDFHLATSTGLGGKPGDWAHRLLLEGRAIVLIDGVDEAAESRRDEIRQWLADLIGQYPDARFVVTSRPYAAQEGWLDAQGFVDANLQEMGREDIYTFVDQWHAAIGAELDPEEKEELEPLAEVLKGRLRTDGSVFKLANSPLLCAILCALHRDRNQDLPRDRVELYRACIEMFFRRDRGRNMSMDSDYLQLSDRQKHHLLQRLAWWFIKNGVSAATPDETDDRFEAELANLKERPEGSSGWDVRRLMVERVGILRQLSETKIDFPHRTFQEYLAAHQFVSDNDIGLLVKHAHEDQWRGVVVLAAGLMDNPTSAETLITRIVERGDKEKSVRVALHLVAAAALKSRISLIASSELEGKVAKRLQKIVPPDSVSDAKELAAGGELVVPYLKFNPNSKWKVGQAAGAVRTLALIGTETAIEGIIEYAKNDSRKGVLKEILRSIAGIPEELVQMIEPHLFSAQITSDELNLANTSLENLSSLASCSSLKILNLNGTQVVDVSPLASCRFLEVLNLSGTQVNDVSALASCTSLRRLDLSGTQVCDVSALASCTSLWDIDLMGTQVSDVNELRAAVPNLTIVGVLKRRRR